MLEFAAVLTTGGLLLFANVLEIDPKIFISLVNRIIDSKNLQSELVIDSIKINYLYDAVLGLIFVIGWRKEIDMDYPRKLLQLMSIAWKNIQKQFEWKDNLLVNAPSFKEPWQHAYENWMNYVNRKDEKGTVMMNNNKSIKDKNNQKTQIQQQKAIQPQTNDNQPKLSALQRMQMLQKKSGKSPKQSPAKEEEKKKQKKAQREWEGGELSKKEKEKLDKSKIKIQQAMPTQMYFDDQKTEIKGFVNSDEETDEKQQESSSFLSKWVGKIKNVVGDKKITREDLKDVLAEFKEKLMQKNVAHDVAEKVSEAVGVTLLETKTKSFTSVHKTVKEAMKDALRKILTPKNKIDLVVEVTKHREKMKPYVIVFIGVNGVGKSTNLAKVAYKLKSAKLSVMLAACDNFRAGAVEQIQTHGRNLEIPVFQKGYKEEPATIAFEAIQDATKKRVDALLIDTAGRMQDNKGLMKELGRLVKISKPNLVIFIGQALVGNDSVDQITKFNSSLMEQATEQYSSQINAILLSKFDTVDDKVGTALSLVYSTSKPILYVGVGQKYPNLKELNVSTVVQALLS